MFFAGSYSINVFPPPLSKDEEELCLEQMKNGSIEARNKLIEHNLRLIAHLVKKYESKDISSDDLISIGTIGLIKGVDSYDPNKNIKITTYIAKCAENEILMYFRSSKKYNNEVSLNDSIGTDKDGNDITLIDVIPSNDEDVATKILNNIDVEMLHKYLDVLSHKERDIIVMRYGLFNGDVFTQKEIAKEMKISRSYVSRMEKRALIKLYREFYKK
jgi:RNA polymerase sporulation-specific sigma factor